MSPPIDNPRTAELVGPPASCAQLILLTWPSNFSVNSLLATAGGGGGLEHTRARNRLNKRVGEIGTRVQEGNLSREDAQAQFHDDQIEIISAAIEDVRVYAVDDEGLTVENTNKQLGAVLISGPAAAVLGTLDADSVNSLLSASDFPTP